MTAWLHCSDSVFPRHCRQGDRVILRTVQHGRWLLFLTAVWVAYESWKQNFVCIDRMKFCQIPIKVGNNALKSNWNGLASCRPTFKRYSNTEPGWWIYECYEVFILTPGWECEWPYFTSKVSPPHNNEILIVSFVKSHMVAFLSAAGAKHLIDFMEYISC